MKLVIIPTYNELDNVNKLIPAIFDIVPDLHILIVDDNSPDGTGDLIAEWAETLYSGKLFILRRPGKLGLGSAYIAGFKWALAKGYRHILEMDADFSHNPAYLPNFLRTAESCHLVLGSRYIKGGGVTNWSLIRKLVSRGGCLYSRLILGLPFKDLTGGYKCFRREVLEQIDLDSIQSNGYSFQIEMTYRAFLKGFTIREIPIIFDERCAGKSKMSGNIFREAVMMVPKLRLTKKQLQHGLPSTPVHVADAPSPLLQPEKGA